MDLAEAFREAGFETALCSDLRSARVALRERPFDLVVLDVLLPDGDGLDLLREIRAREEIARTPVMLLSSEAEVADRIRGLQTGADDYTGKPYDRAYVIARGREMIRRRSTRRTDEPRLILVIDDSATARDEIATMLAGAGYAAVTAGSGEEGLRLARLRRPDAVIVDNVLPGIGGDTVLRRLREDAALRRVPGILVTGDDRVTSELGALEAGADAFVRKGEGLDVLLARLSALLRSTAPQAGMTEPVASGARKILAVDHSETWLQEVSSQLREEGYDVVLARSGDEALRLVGVDRIDCVLVDLSMSSPTGTAICRRIKSRPALRQIPVIVLTAHEDRASLVDAVEAGADDFLIKSADFDVLRARLRVQLRRRQLEEENRFERNAAILETISDAFFAVDVQWRGVYVNRQAEDVLGMRRGELLGRSLWESLPRLAGTRFEEELRRAVAERSPVTFEDQLSSREGWYEVRAFPHDQGLTVYLRDVTERRRTAEVQRHLLGIVGHDLRSPLAAILVMSSHLSNDPALAEKHRARLCRIASAATRMGRMLRDLLDYSQARLGGGFRLEPTAADLGAICRDVIAEQEAANPGRRIEYSAAGDGAGCWDSDRLQQALSNLVGNALRYGAPGTPIRVGWRCEGDEKTLFVHNQGSPIPPELLARIFEPFTRGEQVRTPEHGVGLGLFIVQQIARAHGGDVEARSDAESGTCFTIRLPARIPA